MLIPKLLNRTHIKIFEILLETQTIQLPYGNQIESESTGKQKYDKELQVYVDYKKTWLVC